MSIEDHQVEVLRVEVLIVGAGPVGLSAAIELGRRGVRCLVVERNDRVGYSPRAKTTNVRTREHLRRWGIADALRQASPIAPDRPSTVVFATRMNGHFLARFENALSGSRERNNLYSEEAQWVPQYILEDVLRQRAQSFACVTVRFETEFVSFEQTAQGVTAKIRDLRSGGIANVESAYLIGADGARSAVREAIGAAMVGEGAFSKNYTIIFKAPDLAARNTFEQAIMYWMVNEDVPSLLGPMDEQGLWFFMATKLDADPATIDAADLIRRGTGLARSCHRDRRHRFLGGAPAGRRPLCARPRVSRRRCLPSASAVRRLRHEYGHRRRRRSRLENGGASCGGWGGDDLLASYEIERRKVHERTIAEAVYNYGSVANQLVRPALEEPGVIGEATRREVADIIAATKVREFKTLGIVLGMRYEDSPIVVSDGSEPPVDHFMLYVPSAHPGCLAPHLWLADGSSLYDHFGDGFTLLVTGGDAKAADALLAAAAKRNVPVKVLALPDKRLRSRYEAGFALIRPDQHVAWRGDSFPADCDALIARITGAQPITATAPLMAELVTQ